MMDGPDHVVAAEASFAKAQAAGLGMDGATAVLQMQAAQFHATMALVHVVAALIPPGSPRDYNWQQGLKKPRRETQQEQ